ncbi:uncharacterized protein BT62DRAFT_1007016 [Guyanagaster necrorhizus]|uniref:Uncharacterized protein n=1 Tax=Guyanagaster necrorhizus TaxID=856835 RepID=A0A9P8ARN9_9AGAR|nr:uncharacterized protein BT62DRAFT_1007016 [Guyanagaster necrorhizus MCA 3950]KAG7445310.1 hypothetical protein BT62DRAFT_1007016 [Guyanagaster necrorhizus MCA 3950]
MRTTSALANGGEPFRSFTAGHRYFRGIKEKFSNEISPLTFSQIPVSKELFSVTCACRRLNGVTATDTGLWEKYRLLPSETSVTKPHRNIPSMFSYNYAEELQDLTYCVAKFQRQLPVLHVKLCSYISMRTIKAAQCKDVRLYGSANSSQ